MWRVWFLLKIDDPHAAVQMFVAVSKKLFIAMIILAGVTAIFSCLTAFAADGPQCSGHELIEQYRPRDFVGLILVSGWIAFMVSLAAWPTPWRREQIKKSFERGTQVMHGPESFQMTDGAPTAYVAIFSLCGMSLAAPGI